MDKVVFVGLGKLWDWWGLDIFIKTLKEYQGKKREIQSEFIILGEGREWKKLNRLVKSIGLETQVIFAGTVPDSLVYAKLSKAHIGVGTLALNRKKVLFSSSLKHREYASYGLPFFFVGEDKDFKNVPGVLSLKNEKQLKVASLIDWFRQLDESTISNLKGYADAVLPWSVKLESVVKVL